MKKIIIAGNWKMNTSISEAENLYTNINNYLTANNYSNKVSFNNDSRQILICPPFLYLQQLQNLATQDKSIIKVGSQNLHQELKGAYTGEISATMLQSIGISHSIIGHSERRQYFAETDELIAKKIRTSLLNNITPIFCIGESLYERENGITNEVLAKQLQLGLSEIMDLEQGLKAKIIIAYEPVWAIGTGLAATSKQVSETHTFIKEELSKLLNLDLPILYGGSLNEKNAEELLNLENVNGGLIGGASLKAESFTTIIEISNSIQ